MSFENLLTLDFILQQFSYLSEVYYITKLISILFESSFKLFIAVEWKEMKRIPLLQYEK